MADPNAIRAGKAVVELSADDSKLKAATQRSAKYLHDLGKASHEVNSASSGGFFDRLAARARSEQMDDRASGENALQRALGSKEGAAGFLADTLGVGLQAMVAGAIGTALKSATEQAVSLKEQLRQGKITEEELYRGLATGIPILGDFVAGFLNIRELVTGERAEIERITQEMKRGEAAMNAKVRAAQQYRDILRQITTEASRAVLATQGAGADDYSKERDQIAQTRRELEETKADLDVGISKRADEYYASKQKELEAAEEKVRTANAKRERELDNHRLGGKVNAKAKERYDQDPEYLAAKAEADRLRKEANDKKQEIIDAEKKSVNAQLGTVAARDKENNDRRARDYAQSYAEADRMIATALTAGTAQRLRLRGKEHDAEMAQLQTALDQQIKSIDTAEQDRIRKFGLKPGSKEYDQVKEQAEAQRQAARNDNTAKVEAAGVKEYERQRREALSLREIQNQAIQDQQKREMAALDDKHTAELEMAQNAGRDTYQIALKWEVEKSNLQEQHRRENAQREREEALRLEQLKLQGIDNRNQRELAAIDAKYRGEIKEAEANPGTRDPAAIRQQWTEERGQAQRRQALDTADAIRDIDLQIERERTAIQKRGISERLAQIEIDRREALRREADPRTTTGIGADKVNELYGLRQQRELMGRGSAAGSFSAAELSRMGGEGPINLIAKHTKETADNTRRMVDSGMAFGA